MPRLTPLIELEVVTSGAAASSAADIGCSIKIISTRCDARPGPKELDRFLGALGKIRSVWGGGLGLCQRKPCDNWRNGHSKKHPRQELVPHSPPPRKLIA